MEINFDRNSDVPNPVFQPVVIAAYHIVLAIPNNVLPHVRFRDGSESKDILVGPIRSEAGYYDPQVAPRSIFQFVQQGFRSLASSCLIAKLQPVCGGVHLHHLPRSAKGGRGVGQSKKIRGTRTAAARTRRPTQINGIGQKRNQTATANVGTGSRGSASPARPACDLQYPPFTVRYYGEYRTPT